MYTLCLRQKTYYYIILFIICSGEVLGFRVRVALASDSACTSPCREHPAADEHTQGSGSRPVAARQAANANPDRHGLSVSAPSAPVGLPLREPARAVARHDGDPRAGAPRANGGRGRRAVGAPRLQGRRGAAAHGLRRPRSRQARVRRPACELPASVQDFPRTHSLIPPSPWLQGLLDARASYVACSDPVSTLPPSASESSAAC